MHAKTEGQPFDLVSNESARIHDRLLKVHYDPDGTVDGSMYCLEATADSDARFQQYLPVHGLKHITLDMLPSHFYLMIEQPRSVFSYTILVTFRRLEYDGEFAHHIGLDYASWHLPTNLQDFADQLRKELLQGGQLRRVDVSCEDGSIYMTCVAALSAADDLFSRFKAIDAEILAAYKKCMRVVTELRHPLPGPAENPNIRGLRWWLQHVIVPILGSSAFAALVAWLISSGANN